MSQPKRSKENRKARAKSLTKADEFAVNFGVRKSSIINAGDEIREQNPNRQGHSMRFIAKRLGLHRNTVKKYILGKRFSEYRRSQRRVSILSPFVRIIQDLVRQDNFRASWIFNRLKQICYTGGYDTVKSFVRPLKEQQARIAYSRFETMPGRQAQIDWADFKITEPSRRTTTVYLFLMQLGYSRAMYGEFVQRCTLESFLDCHKRAFHYLGGVPDEVLYDNMQVHFNINLQHFAHHFSATPKVCPPYCPRVRAKVERSVVYIHESFWRGYGFNSIEQANRDLFAWLDKVANTRVHISHRQPIAERWQQEKASLRQLPAAETFVIFD